MAEGETPTKQFVKVDPIVVPIRRRLWPRTKSGKPSLDVPEIRCQLQCRESTEPFFLSRFLLHMPHASRSSRKLLKSSEEIVDSREGDRGGMNSRQRPWGEETLDFKIYKRSRGDNKSAPKASKSLRSDSTAMCTPSVRAGETARMLSPVVGIISKTTTTWPKRNEVWSNTSGKAWYLKSVISWSQSARWQINIPSLSRSLESVPSDEDRKSWTSKIPRKASSLCFVKRYHLGIIPELWLADYIGREALQKIGAGLWLRPDSQNVYPISDTVMSGKFGNSQ